MTRQIEELKASIEPLRQEIINHVVYSEIKSLDDLKIFMQYHIFAVWDFMSILKALQNNLTCTSVPWFPKGDGQTRHLINEIVAGEESDVDMDGNHKSHYELYLDAMNQCQADTSQISTFIETLQKTNDLNLALQTANAPQEAQNFVNFTFETIQTQKDYLQSAIFTFGREDLIPGMFFSIVNDLHKNLPESISIFKYYLDRHIELDGDHHSHLALQMTANLCGTDAEVWKEAEIYTIQSLKKRIELWDGAYKAILKSRS